MIDTLVGQQGLEQIWIWIGAGPHYVEILVTTSNLLESVGKKDLADNSRLTIDQSECEMIPRTSWVRLSFSQNVTIEYHDRVSLSLHGGSPLQVHSFVVCPGAGERDPGLTMASLLALNSLLGPHLLGAQFLDEII